LHPPYFLDENSLIITEEEQQKTNDLTIYGLKAGKLMQQALKARCDIYQIIDLNLPFNANIEKTLMTSYGIKLTKSQLMDLFTDFFKNTGYGIKGLLNVFDAMLLNLDARNYVFESLAEYLAYDNYLKSVKSTPTPQKQTLKKK